MNNNIKSSISGKSLLNELVRARDRFENTHNREQHYKTLENIYKLAITIDEPAAYLAVAEIANDKNEQKVYLEKYFQNPIEFPNYPLNMAYRTLANIYLDEKDFLNAAKYYELSQLAYCDYYYTHCLIYGYDKITHEYGPIDMNAYRLEHQGVDTRAGKLYLKAGTLYAIDFWNRQKERSFYTTTDFFKRIVDEELSKVLALHERHYVFKTRERRIKKVPYYLALVKVLKQIPNFFSLISVLKQVGELKLHAILKYEVKE